ncbi:MAG: protoheme IX farnesyltransferase [Ignavibacteria bacterium]|nr:protoheme IX farnesyltransferase [Ignavibacteria bacterium]
MQSTSNTQTASPLSNQMVGDTIIPDLNSGILRQYYELTKPGITQMVALSTLTAYYLALQVDVVAYASSVVNWLHFFETMLGTIAISAGSCVFNHVMERKNDGRMKRTALRPIPSGAISVKNAIVFGVVLTVIGAALIAPINMLTLALAAITWVLYVAVYTPLKQRTKWALIVGSIPGALPFVGGWTAVRGTIDAPALVLFAILFAWQIPHFLALSWMYRSDYREGGFVLRSLTDESGTIVAWQTLLSTIVTALLCMLPWIIGVTGTMYIVGAVGLCGWMTYEAIRFVGERSHSRARKVLLTSYAVLMGVYILVLVDKV